MNSAVITPKSDDFSLILGGPLYQIFQKAHLSGSTLEHLTRRIIVLCTVAWLPLLVLSLIEGNAWGRHIKVPFLFDADVHARFLVALPLFILAELIVHQRMQMVVRQFLVRGLVPDHARTKFDAAFASAMRLRNSISAEILLLVFVYLVGVMVIWRSSVALPMAVWYAVSEGERQQTSMAGRWFGCVSLPLIQFILLRWYFRLFIWARFLWHVSRIDLKLVPTHPDYAAGLGFLSNTVYAFAPLLIGQGVMLAGVIANKIFFAGAKLPDFKLEILGLVMLMVFIVIGPTLVFVPMLARTRQKGLTEYGELAQRYVREFDEKWLRSSPKEALVGSADIQSLADLGNSFEVVKSMKLAPCTKETLFHLIIMTLLPIAPLILTMIPLSELIDRLVQVAF